MGVKGVILVTMSSLVPRVVRRVQDNMFHRKEYDPTLRIENPGKLGAAARLGKEIDQGLAEEGGWVPASQMDARLLLAAYGGYQRSIEKHLSCISPYEALVDNVAVIKSALDAYTRPADFTWLVLSNGVLSLAGEFDLPEAAALRVCIDCHRMLDPTSVDKDTELPALRIASFTVQKRRLDERTIAFERNVQLVGLTNDSSSAARQVAQDAALSFLRTSGNRSRVLAVGVQALGSAEDIVGPVISARLFDIEYRWRDLAKEEARFNGSAEEMRGDLFDRAEAVVDGIKQRQIVAAIVSHAVRAVPHANEELISRLKRYDQQLMQYPTLVNETKFISVIGAVSESLMPRLEAELASNPTHRHDPGFVESYNLCARYAAQPPLVHV